MKFLITGANGQLGYDLRRVIPEKHKILGFSKSELDITDFDKVRKILKDVKPDVVINCASYNNVDEAEDKVEEAFRVNAYAVKVMAETCSEIKSLFVNISTDYVFDGKKNKPYEEKDEPNPLSSYGLSKLLGEMFTKRCDRFILVRSPGLYGIWGSRISGRSYRNFPERVIENLKSGVQMRVVVDRISAPVYTYELAQKIYEVIEKGIYGLLHIGQKGEISWFDFASKIADILNLDKKLLVPVKGEELNSKAMRPSYSVLRNTVLEENGIDDLSDIETALKKYIKERAEKFV